MAECRSEKRDVLVVGKAGAGKSTVCNKLVHQDIFEVDWSPNNVTQNIRHSKIKVQVQNVTYECTIFDTVGFFGPKIRNDHIIQDLKAYFQANVTDGLNLVLFVFQKGRFTQEENAAFEYLTENFKDNISQISAFLVTHCDEIDEKGRQELIQEFKDNEATKEIARFMKKGIHAVGFPSTEGMKRALISIYEEEMKKDKKLLMDIVLKSEERHLREEIFQQDFWEKLKSCTIL